MPGHPVLLSRKDGHSIWVNSLALERAGITRDTPDPPGGRIGRAADGTANGMLYEGAAEDLVYRVVEEQDEPEAWLDTLRLAIANAQRAGLTGFHNCEDQQAYQAFADLEAAGDLGIRVLQLIAYPELDAAIAAGRKSGDGSHRLRTGPVKIFSDGSLGSLTAEMLAAVRGHHRLRRRHHPPGRTGRRDPPAPGRPGSPSPSTLSATPPTAACWTPLRKARHDGTAPARPPRRRLHPLGAAPSHRTRPAPGSRRLGRFAEWGVIASMQPIHCTADMEMADRWLGARAAHGTYAWRSLRTTARAWRSAPIARSRRSTRCWASMPPSPARM